MAAGSFRAPPRGDQRAAAALATSKVPRCTTSGSSSRGWDRRSWLPPSSFCALALQAGDHARPGYATLCEMARRSALTPREHARKEQVLTQHQPARVAQTADALVLKDGDHFLLCGQSGDVPLRPGHGLGLYWRDCRFLSGYELALEGEAPIALSSTA